MYRTGIVLAAASALGFLANFLFSAMLGKDSYGALVSMFSAVSVLVLAAPMGTNVYYLTKRELLYKSSNSIITIPLLIALLIGGGYLIYNQNMVGLAFLMMLSASTIAVQGVMLSQIEQNGPQAALYQSAQTLLKSIAALVSVVCFFMGFEQEVISEVLILSLVVSSALLIPFMLNRLIDIGAGGPIISLAFLIRLNKLERKRLLSFWLSSALGTAFSLGVVPLIAYFHSAESAAYLGIYLIFWSGGNIVVALLINHHYWPRYCAIRSEGAQNKTFLYGSLRVCMLCALALFLMISCFAALFSEAIWPDYPGLKLFLVITAIPIAVRVISAWLGMMILNFGALIISKTKVQLVMLNAMVISVAAINEPTHETISWLLLILEFGYFFGYFFISLPVLRRAFLQHRID